jgi:aminocarboxymuconate-semialdehyde decarboxylase
VTVDVHAHVIVSEITRDAAPDEAWRPHVCHDERGTQVVELDGRAIRSAVREFVDVDAIVAAQEEAGIEHTVLSPWVPLLWYDVDGGDSLRRSRIQNEALAELACSRRRVSALGTVPLQSPAAAARELRRLMAEGELAGVEVAASARGRYLGDERFEPFWAAAEESGALVFVHPTTRGFAGHALAEHYLWNTVGNPLETTVTAAHMVMAGVLERHPALGVVLAHGGGALLALRGRLAHAHGFQPQARARLREPVERSLRRFYYDTITHDAGLLRALVEFVGAEHVLLGTDYPFDMADERAVETVRACGLDRAAEEAILGGNAQRLLRLARAEREEMIG